MARAAIYARRSTDEQKASLPSQIEACEQRAKAQGWEVVDFFQDTASGWKPGTSRPGFDAMMQAARAGDFEVLIVWEISRLSRQGDGDSALAIVWDLRKSGVEVDSVIDPSTGNPMADDLLLYLKGVAAKEESDVKSERTRRGKRVGLKEGVHQGRQAPYGYDGGTLRPFKTERRQIKFYEPIPEAVAVVRRIFFEFIEQRRSPFQIAAGLNDDGIPPPQLGWKLPQSRKGDPVWHRSSVKGLLANPILAGWVTYKGHRLKACDCGDLETPEGWQDCEHEWVRTVNIPAIIEPEVWEAAQVVIEQRTRPHMRGKAQHSGNEMFLLAGLLRCAACGERWTTRRPYRAGSIPKYYCCGKKLGICDVPRQASLPIDEAVRELFVRQFTDAVDVQRTVEAERDRLLALRAEEAGLIEDELRLVRAEVTRLESLRIRIRSDYESGAITADQWSRLDTDYDGTLSQQLAALDHLQTRLDECGETLGVGEIDALLDQLAIITEMVEGHLTAESTPRLNEQLHDVFEEFLITVEGDRVVIDPKLKPEYLPPGQFTELDFGEGNEGVEVVEFLSPAIRKVALTREFMRDEMVSSSRTADRFVASVMRVVVDC